MEYYTDCELTIQNKITNKQVLEVLSYILKEVKDLLLVMIKNNEEYPMGVCKNAKYKIIKQMKYIIYKCKIFLNSRTTETVENINNIANILKINSVGLCIEDKKMLK